jgi:hypothetical protein
MKLMTRKLGSLVLIVCVLFAGLPTHAFAGIIGTERVIAAQPGNSDVARLQSYLSREDVARELQRLGVDPVAAQERVAALTDQELRQLGVQVNELPAGAGVVEIIGITFIVLLILELTGVINIFTAF